MLVAGPPHPGCALPAGDPLLGATPSLAQALEAVRGSVFDTAAPQKMQVGGLGRMHPHSAGLAQAIAEQVKSATPFSLAFCRCQALAMPASWCATFTGVSLWPPTPNPSAPGRPAAPLVWVSRQGGGAGSRGACPGAGTRGAPAAQGAAAACGGCGGLPLPRPRRRQGEGRGQGLMLLQAVP